ncbi:MAG: hypothetical protein WC700_17565, partial [Gemmatimonadaceae bacterium]
MRLTWHVPPACQGQIVEVAYCQVGDILLRRTIDQSDRSVAYEAAPLDDDEIEGIEPWNCEPR